MDEREAQADLDSWISEEAPGKVYWGDVPADQQQPTFTINGSDDRPDFLVTTKNHTAVIELKDGNDSQCVYDGVVETHNYWYEYQNKNIDYVVENDTVDVDVFLLATRHSPEGRLFKQSREKMAEHSVDYEDGDPAEVNARDNAHPREEYNQTWGISRVMWRYMWRDLGGQKKEDRNKPKAGLGVLLSDTLNPESQNQSSFAEFSENIEDRPRPYALFMHSQDNSIWEPL